MKYFRYLIFAFEDFYPSGGMNDFEKSFKTEEEVKKYIKERKNKEHTNFQVVDMTTGEISTSYET